MKKCSTSQLLEKWKLKLQWGTTSYQSERPWLKSLQINAGEGVEKKEPFYIVDKKVNLYIHYGQQYVWKALSRVRLFVTLWTEDYTVHGILQARTLEWVAFPFSSGSSQPRDRTQVSRISGRFFTS